MAAPIPTTDAQELANAANIQLGTNTYTAASVQSAVNAGGTSLVALLELWAAYVKAKGD